MTHANRRNLGLNAFSTILLATFSFAAPAPSSSAAETPEVGQVAPDFTLDSIAGKPVQLSKVAANGPVVLVVLRGYPGYQCPICSRQVAELVAKAKPLTNLKARVILVYPGPAESLKAHADEFLSGKTLPDHFDLLLDPDYTFTTAYGLRWDAPKETAYPSTFVLDPDRKIRFAKVSRTHGGRVKVADVLDSLQKPH